MKTSSFLSALRFHSALPLVFRAGRDVVAPGYHLTEVKRVSYETMDCGAITHRWAESQFEIWVPPLIGNAPGRVHMAAEKFLGIIERVEADFPLNSEAVARIHASFAGLPAALYSIDAVNARDGKLWIELKPDKAQCKAAERRLGAVTGGCCGIGADESEEKEAGRGCCGSTTAETSATACCA